MNLRLGTVCVAAALAAAWCGPAMAENAKPMALQGIMQQLEANMDSVQGAISREDWQTVVQLAPKIAHHEQPPLMEKIRILTWLNVDALKFKGLDGDVAKAATAMGEAAKKGDKEAVIADYAKINESCVACHSAYRAKFIAHFGQ